MKKNNKTWSAINREPQVETGRLMNPRGRDEYSIKGVNLWRYVGEGIESSILSLSLCQGFRSLLLRSNFSTLECFRNEIKHCDVCDCTFGPGQVTQNLMSEVNFQRCKFVGVSFSFNDFWWADFYDCVFEDCIFYKNNVGGMFFGECKFNGTSHFGSNQDVAGDYADGRKMEAIRFRNCLINGDELKADYYWCSDLSRSIFKSDCLTKCNFSDINTTSNMKDKHILLVVDMQKDFISGPLGSSEAKSIVPNVKNKVDDYHKNGGLIIYTQDTHGDDYLNTQEGKNLPVPHCIEGSDGWEIDGEVDVLSGIYIRKNSFGYGSWNKVIEEHWQKFSEVEEIEVVGLCTDICVISNVMILKSLLPEVKITVDASCCAGVSPESHKNALSAMKMCQVNIINE